MDVTPTIALIDYGAGNLRSISRALAGAGARVTLAGSPQDADRFDGLVLPGVGAFGAAMERLDRAGFVDWLRTQASGGVPLVGVCLGMQLLFERSEEGGDVAGLGLLPGRVRRLPDGLKVPHMGWNQLILRRPSPILHGISDAAYLYFVHSYVVAPREASDIVATSVYGVEFPAVVHHDHLVGLQFHPEKSAQTGQRLLRTLVGWVAARAAERAKFPV